MQKAYNAYKTFIKGICKVLDVITIALMLAMLGVVSYQVVMRQFFNRPPVWGEEVAVTLMIQFVFLGIVLGLEENIHIGIALLVKRLPKKGVFVVEIIINVLLFVLSALFIRFGYIHASRILAFGTRLTATQLPAAIHYAVVPIAGILMCLVVVGKLAGIFINRREMLS